MTREEAIKILKAIRVYECYPKSASEETKEAIDMAIEALSPEEPKTGAKIVPKEESDMYITGYRDGHDDATKTARWIQKDLCADRFCSNCDYVV